MLLIYLTICAFTVSSFLELILVLFEIPGVTCFLTEKLSQDALQKFFGIQYILNHAVIDYPSN